MRKLFLTLAAASLAAPGLMAAGTGMAQVRANAEDANYNDDYEMTMPGEGILDITWYDVMAIWPENEEASIYVEDAKGVKTDLVFSDVQAEDAQAILILGPEGWDWVMEYVTIRINYGKLDLADGNYTLVMPAGMFGIQCADWSDTLNPEITYEFTVGEPVEENYNYDYEMTKPDADILDITWYDVMAIWPENEDASIYVEDAAGVKIDLIFSDVQAEEAQAILILGPEGWDWVMEYVTLRINYGKLDLVDGNYTLVVPAGMFGIMSGDGSATINPEITYNFVVGDPTTGVDAIEGNAAVDVYTLTGVQVLRGADANAVNALPAGLYIINGKKVMVR